MIGQHDAASPQPDRRRCCARMRNHQRRRCASYARHAVMFGNPVTFITKPFRMCGKIGGIRKGGDDVAAFNDGDKVENGKCRSEEHTSELQSLMRISYAVFCLKKKNKYITQRIQFHVISLSIHHYLL